MCIRLKCQEFSIHIHIYTNVRKKEVSLKKENRFPREGKRVKMICSYNLKNIKRLNIKRLMILDERKVQCDDIIILEIAFRH
jgi:predicted ThiF/HesA family dinucleotide-utilizing enzyme